jgi:DNA polymerase V
VGNRIARKLNVLGIKTALDLALTNPAFIRKNFSVVLERTVRELNGKAAFRLRKPLRRNSKLSAAAVLA